MDFFIYFGYIFSMVLEAKDGRIYISKDFRDNYGEKFKIVEGDDHLILVPIFDDPLKKLREEWSDIDKSVDQLKKEALD